jgi:hypothetical protein
MGEGLKRARAAARASRKPYTLADAMEAVARSLREFGYSDVTAGMVQEIYDAYAAGKRFPDLPHGVIGGFAESHFDEVADKLKTLPSH